MQPIRVTLGILFTAEVAAASKDMSMAVLKVAQGAPSTAEAVGQVITQTQRGLRYTAVRVALGIIAVLVMLHHQQRREVAVVQLVAGEPGRLLLALVVN